VLVAIADAAAAASFTISEVSGAWSNPNVSKEHKDKIKDVDIDGELQIRWGQKLSDDRQQSGLGFKGNAGLTLQSGQLFELGQLRHFNNTIKRGAVRDVDFDLTLAFSEVDIQTLTFNLDVTETSNIYDEDDLQAFGLPDAKLGETKQLDHCDSDYRTYSNVETSCADAIAWTTLIPDQSQTFVQGGKKYHFELLGFRTQPDGLPTQSFLSDEKQITTAAVMARLTQVPEPGSVLSVFLLGGLLGLARRAKQQRRLKHDLGVDGLRADD
jgi:hypothetical protein